MNEFELAQRWGDPANWHFGILYRAQDDPRLLVPMRGTNAGWTPNIAHSRAILLAAALAAIALAPGIGVWMAGLMEKTIAFPLVLIWFLAVVVPVGVLVRRGLE